MSTWSQVYDDDQALDDARRRARGLLIGFALVSGLLVSVAPVAAFTLGAQGGLVALACGALLVLSATVVVVQLAREHRRLWRIELSMRRVVGHDAAGRRQVIRWAAVRRVDVSDAGVSVVGGEDGGVPVRLHIAPTMPAFSAAAHRVVEYAEAHGRTVCVDGCPIESMDLATLYPALCESVRPVPSRAGDDA